MTLGAVTFDAETTRASEKHEEVGGRDERVVKIAGVVNGSTIADVEAQLDAILDAASVEDFSADLSLREGRRLLVRRDAYKREVSANPLTGSFELTLKAKDPFEESAAVTALNWNVTVSGATLVASSAGNAPANPVVTLVATGDVVNPSISDGERTMTYMGVVQDGETLVMDGVAKIVTLEGGDVTPYTSGVFPEISPEWTTLTYTDDAASSHTAAITVAYRDRWW